jgi:hypothetical protein
MFRPPSLLTPRSSLPLRILPQGSRGFYVRAYCALLPPHTPDMLTVRIQAIDGTGTFTLPDFQPYRLLTSLQPHYRAFVTTTGCSAPALRFGLPTSLQVLFSCRSPDFLAAVWMAFLVESAAECGPDEQVL